MKQLICTTAIIGSLLYFNPMFAQDNTASLEDKAEQTVNQMNEKLSLNQEQYDQIYEITLRNLEKKTDIKKRNKERLTNIQDVLSDEQKAAYSSSKKGKNKKGQSKEEKANDIADKMQKELKLTKSQRSKLYDLTIKNMTAQQKMAEKKKKAAASGKADKSDKEAFAAEQANLKKEHNSALDNILSAEQRQKLKDSQKKKRATTSEGRATEFTELLNKKVNLTKSQYQEVYNINLDYLKFEEKTQAELSGTKGKMEKILNEEQRVIAKKASVAKKKNAAAKKKKGKKRKKR
ncbi:MAG: hypothetical protein ACPG5B_08615 [Chitinophagales bacterium]